MKFLLLAVHSEFALKNQENIGIHRIAQYLRKNGFSCDVCEIGFDNKNIYLEKALAGEYVAIGVSSTYFFLLEELEAMAPFYKAKQLHPCLFFAGGNSPSHDDKLWLDIGFDFVVRGYGEYPLLEIAKKIDALQNISLEAISSVPGISYKINDILIRNPPLPLSEKKFYDLNYDLEMELVPIRKMYPTIFPEFKEAFYPEIKKIYNVDDKIIEKSVTLYTSHQCPNRCGYCCSSSFLERIYGNRHGFFIDAHHIYNIIRAYCKKRDAKFFSFWDDDFCRPRARMVDLCNLIIKGKSNGDIHPDAKFQCQTRVLAFAHSKGKERRKIDYKLIDLLYKAGFLVISLGIENFSKRLLHTPAMHKFGYDEAVAMDVIHAMIQNKICPSINFMMCVPEAQPDEVLHNIKKLIELQSMHVSVNIGFYIDAYPGSAVFASPLYPTLEKQVVSPLNQKVFRKKGYLIPHNPHVRQALHEYMETGVKQEFAAVFERFGTSFPVKEDIYLVNLLKCRAMARALPDSADVVEQLSAAIEARLNVIHSYMKSQAAS